MIGFEAAEGRELVGVLRFIADEDSFLFDTSSPGDFQQRCGSAGVTSLSIGTLQLEVAVESRQVLFTWGLHPRARWSSGRLGRPDATPGLVRVNCQTSLDSGVSIELAPVGSWSTSFDEESGWVRVAAPRSERSDRQVLVATGTVVGLSGGLLTEVWLNPVFE